MAARGAIETALISIHDVMPATLAAVDELLACLAPIAPEAVTLLVVPGRYWCQADIDWLHRRQGQGYVLAGHGWLHQCSKPRTLHHRLHSLLVSRNVAEHLSLQPDQIYRLIARCHRWFEEQGLRPPGLYVPPAWAMGNVDRGALGTLPFQQYETVRGIYHPQPDLFDALPLTGYEADTPWRAVFLRAFNQHQRCRSASSGLALRMGLHPRDLQFLLAADLRDDVQQVKGTCNYQNYRHAPLSAIASLHPPPMNGR